MEHRKDSQERGQAIIIVAFAIIALAALVGLAVDGGNLYTMRRRAQIGADSSAMAGARVLADLISRCSADASQDGAIMAEILEFARDNRIDDSMPNGDVTAWYVNKDMTDLGFVGTGTIPNGATGIRVAVVTTDTTTFMRVFGFEHVVAPGDATVLVGPVTSMGGGGMLPIAVWDEVVKRMNPGDEFAVRKGGEFKDFCEVTCPECCTGGVDSSAQRGWLQLGHIYNKDDSIMDRAFTTSLNAGTASMCKPPNQAGLIQWINPECMYPYSIYAGQEGMDNGDFIAGMTGEESTGDKAIEDYWLGKVAYAPVFDVIFSGTCSTVDPRMETIFSSDMPQPIDAWVTGCSGYYFHITGFVAVKLMYYQGHGPDEELVGEFQYATIKAGQINPGDGFGSGTTCVPGVVGIMLAE